MTNPNSPGERVEGAIERGIRQGDFDKLPGAGKPLDLGDPRDPDWWIKDYATREKLDLAEAMPGVAALRKESLEFTDNLERFESEDEVRSAAEDLNHRILEDRKDLRNLQNTFPLAAPELDVDSVVKQWKTTQVAKVVAKPAAADSDQPVDRADSQRSAVRTLYLRALMIAGTGIGVMVLAIVVAFWVFG